MSVRDERLMMADKRALAKQSERLNPVEPLKNTTRKGRTTLVNKGAEYTGSGATPSMGLSQVRGGRTRRQRSPSPAEDGMSGGGKYEVTIEKRGNKYILEYRGGIYSEHDTLEEAEDALEQANKYSDPKKHAKIKRMGLEIPSYERLQRGKTSNADAYGEAAAKLGLTGRGMVGAGMLGQTRHVGAGTKKGEMRLTARKAYEPDAHSMGAALGTHLKQLHGSGFYEDFRKGMELGEVADDEMEGGLKTGRYEGKGKLVIQHLPHGEGEELVVGKGSHDRVREEEQKGCGKKTRKPAGPSDKRRARGAMVSKLMREKGMTLAEASRHIKQHGLA